MEANVSHIFRKTSCNLKKVTNYTKKGKKVKKK